MEWFEEVKKKVSKTAKGAVKVSNDALEYTKLKIKLSELDSSIEELYAKIGKSMYESAKNDCEPNIDIDETIEKISTLKAEADELDDKLSEVTNKKICRYCGAKVNTDSVFCASCGEKLQD